MVEEGGRLKAMREGRMFVVRHHFAEGINVKIIKRALWFTWDLFLKTHECVTCATNKM